MFPVTFLFRKLLLGIILSCCGLMPFSVLHSTQEGDKNPQPLAWHPTDHTPDPLLASFLPKRFGAGNEISTSGDAANPHVCLKCIMGGAPPANAPVAGRLYADSPATKTTGAPSIEGFVGKALTDQRQLLLIKKTALRRWDRNDQAHFAVWFGTVSPAVRTTMQQRIDTVLDLNKQYKVSNFRAASPSRPGVFAYVFPRDTSRVYLDREFFRAPTTERAGTLAHEMSHFLGTQDHAYGPAKCKDLARRSPTLAMQNADNFEFYLEGRR